MSHIRLTIRRITRAVVRAGKITEEPGHEIPTNGHETLAFPSNNAVYIKSSVYERSARFNITYGHTGSWGTSCGHVNRGTS